MAGGKGTRFDFAGLGNGVKEKPMIPIFGKPMILYVMEAALNCADIDTVVITVTDNVPETRVYLEKFKEKYETDKQIIIIKTSGKDFHSDMAEAINRLGDGIYVIMSADIPLIRKDDISRILKKFRKYEEVDGIGALTVVSPLYRITGFGLTPPAFYTARNGELVVPVGINIIRGKYVKVKRTIPYREVYADEIGLLFNVNTLNDYKLLLKNWNKLNFGSEKDKSEHMYISPAQTTR